MLLIPQRYEFSSKSQPNRYSYFAEWCCCWYHKGTNFQANHNASGCCETWFALLLIPQRYEFSSKSQLVSKRKLTILLLLLIPQRYEFSSKSQHSAIKGDQLESCCWYHKGTNFQANHNPKMQYDKLKQVVADTTKVRIFKQITTNIDQTNMQEVLLLIPQRYEFSSKSQLGPALATAAVSCCWYHKGTNFQANHNCAIYPNSGYCVVADTTKVRIFKQITTEVPKYISQQRLLLIPQRYEFSSKSQPLTWISLLVTCCCWYHKGTNFQANHNI